MALAACAAAAIAFGVLPSVAGAETTPPPPPPGEPPPVPPAPAAGAMTLRLQKVGGKPPFVLVGRRVYVRGTVTPYVAGQTVKLSVYRQGRKVAVMVVPVAEAAGGLGQFHISYKSSLSGPVDVRAVHYDRDRPLLRVLQDARRQPEGDGGLQLLHPRVRDPRLPGSAHVRRQPRLPARPHPRRRGDLRVGPAGHAGGRLPRGRWRQQ